MTEVGTKGKAPDRPIGLERAEAKQDRPMASPHGDKTSPCDGKTGLRYKFQRSSATVTYSRSKSGAYLANVKRIAPNRQPVKSSKKNSKAAGEPKLA